MAILENSKARARVCVQLFLQAHDRVGPEHLPTSEERRLAHDRARPCDPPALPLHDPLPHHALRLRQEQTALSGTLPLLELQQPLPWPRRHHDVDLRAR